MLQAYKQATMGLAALLMAMTAIIFSSNAMAQSPLTEQDVDKWLSLMSDIKAFGQGANPEEMDPDKLKAKVKEMIQAKGYSEGEFQSMTTRIMRALALKETGQDVLATQLEAAKGSIDANQQGLSEDEIKVIKKNLNNELARPAEAVQADVEAIEPMVAKIKAAMQN